jgi:hypothetical protein
MRQLFTLMTVTIAIASFAILPVAYGQERPVADKTFTGQLIKIDSSAKTISLKDSDDKEMTFSYTDQTQVVGGERNVQGLTGKTGTPLKVTYREDGGTNHATRIEVLPTK